MSLSKDEKAAQLQVQAAALREAIIEARLAKNKAEYEYKRLEAQLAYVNNDLNTLQAQKPHFPTVWTVGGSASGFVNGSAGASGVISTQGCATTNHSTVLPNAGSVPGA